MKIETRGSRAAPSPSSGGGAARTTGSTRPSAGLTTRPGAVGTTRTGSRKKSAIHPARTRISQNSGLKRKAKTMASAIVAAMNGQPSRWIGGIASRMDFWITRGV